MLRLFAAAALSVSLLAAGAPGAAAQGATESRQVSQKTVGPWSVMGWIAPNGTPYCSAERDVNETRVAFIRMAQGYLLVVRSPSWWLTSGADQPVQVAAAGGSSATLRGKVIASNTILAQLSGDPAAMRRLGEAAEVEVTAADTTIKVPLEQFGDALTALDDCLAHAAQPAQPNAQPPAAPAAPPASAPKFPVDKMRLSVLAADRALAA